MNKKSRKNVSSEFSKLSKGIEDFVNNVKIKDCKDCVYYVINGKCENYLKDEDCENCEFSENCVVYEKCVECVESENYVNYVKCDNNENCENCENCEKKWRIGSNGIIEVFVVCEK